MNNKIEESTPTQVNRSFLEFHDILNRSNPTIAKQLLAGISETDPGAIQPINDALQEASKNWQPNHQRQVADLVASSLTAWAKAATNRQRAQNTEDILNPQVLLDLPKPALFHRTILADTWQLSSRTRQIAQQLQQNDSRQASYTMLALHTRVHESIRQETADLQTLAPCRPRPGDKPMRRATTGHHCNSQVHQQPLERRPRPADGTRPSRTGRTNKRQLLVPGRQCPRGPGKDPRRLRHHR